MACVPVCPTGAIDNWHNVPRSLAYTLEQQFSWDQLPALLTEAQLAAMTTTQMAGLTSTQIGAMTTTEISALSTTQIAALTTTQIDG